MQSNLLNSPSLADPLRWLAHSGIQRHSQDSDAGGVHAWIDEASGQPAFLYSEIAGYFMTLCSHLARWGEAPAWLERAEAAATWTVEQAQHPSGAILARKYVNPSQAAADPYSFEGMRVLLFDCAMVGCGLLAVYESTGRARWLDAACRIGDFCLGAFQSAGRLSAAFDLGTGNPVEPGPRWSQHAGPFELKTALFFDALAEITGRADCAELVERLLSDALSRQSPEGRFPSSQDGETTHLHPHFYAVEGLLYLAARRGRRELLAPARAATDWAFRTCLLAESGAVQQWSTRPEAVIPGLRSDALAQALRAYEVIGILEPERRFDWELEVTGQRRRLETFRLQSGGLSYGEDEYGRKQTHANAWCQFFAVEMELYRLVREGKAALDISRLLLT